MSKVKTMKLRIPELRARCDHMTQAELAKRAGLSKTTISNLESGRLTRIELATIAKLCAALFCTPNDLFQLPLRSEKELVKQQKEALMELIGSIRYDKMFDPDQLDDDLVAITNDDLSGTLRVSEGRRAPKKRNKP